MNQKNPKKRIVIMGAAGRDFHNFNMVYRNDPQSDVLAFTAAQIPGIAARTYPAALAGPYYPGGIQVIAERDLETFCRENHIDQVVFAYSDLPHVEVMHLASRALAVGADFVLLGPACTMIEAAVPVIAVSAVRTGSGKSQTTRYLAGLLKAGGLRVAVVRHPMPYGDLTSQAVQRFATMDDLTAADCTIEEREEYELHIAAGTTVFAGVDYEEIIRRAGAESDVILWDGGNNDFPFVKPDIHIVLVDALRPGHETGYHPGEATLRMADIVVVSKADAANPADTQKVVDDIARLVPDAPIVRAASPVRLEDEAAVKGRRVMIVEDGPTITHGGMAYGAGLVGVTRAGVSEIIDPRRTATRAIREVYAKYPHIGQVLPAMGYDAEQIQELEKTIAASDAEVVVAATPINLGALVNVGKPIIRCFYEYADFGAPTLVQTLAPRLAALGLRAASS